MHTLAYLDAGSGSVIIQAVVAGFAGVAVTLKLFWRRILTFLHIRKPEQDEQGAPMPATAQAPAETSENVAEPTPR